MKTSLAINKMTPEEKISTMESLWDDLCKNTENLSSPSWHKEILTGREEQLKNKKAKFIDWETAKKNIRNKL